MRSRQPEQLFSRFEWALFCVASVLVCLLSLVGVIWFEASQAERAFHQQASAVHEAFSQRLGSLEVVLVSLGALHQDSDDLSSAEFAAFTHELLEAYPYLSSLLWLNNVSHAERNTFVSTMRASGFPQFNLTERDATGHFRSASPRPLYMPLQAIEPFLPMSGQYLGYDAYSDIALTYAIQQAVASGEVAASSPTSLMRSEPSLFIFKAVYEGRYRPRKVAERRSLLQGVMAVELPSRFMADLLTPYPQFAIALQHRETLGTSGQHVDPFYAREAASHDGNTSSWWPRWHVSRELNIYGQPFELTLSYQANIDIVMVESIIFVLLLAPSCLFVFATAMRQRRMAKVAALQAHRAVVAEEQRFRDFAETAADWFWEIDVNLRFTYVSERAHSSVGVAAMHLLGQAWEEVLRACAGDVGVLTWQRHLLTSGQPFQDMVYAWTRPEGTTCLLRCSGKPMLDAQNRFIGYRGTATDITEQTQAEASLREAEEKYRQNLPQTPGIANQPRGGIRMDPTHQLQPLDGRTLCQQLKHILHRNAQIKIHLL